MVTYKVTLDQEARVATLYLSGELEQDDYPPLKKPLIPGTELSWDEVLSSDTVIIDLSGVTLLDSGGAKVLLGFRKRRRLLKKPLDIQLRGLSGSVQKVLELFHFGRIFHIS